MPPARVRVEGPRASQAARAVSSLQCARGGCGAAIEARHHDTGGQKVAMGPVPFAIWPLWPSLVALVRGRQHRLRQSCVRLHMG